MATTVAPQDAAARTAAAAAKTFEVWTLDDARGAVTSASGDDTELIETNELFVDGDHWQDSDGWVGPHPQPGDDGFDETMTEIEKAFTSRNVISEVVERHTSFVLGKEPRWSLVPRRPLKEDEEPSNEEQTLIDEAEAALTMWWDERKLHAVLQNLVRQVLWAERSAFRLYVPSGMLTRREAAQGRTVTVVRATKLEEALAKLWPDHPSYDQSTVVEDPDTKLLCGVFLYSGNVDGSIDSAELSYVLGEQTVIRQVGETDDREFRLNLGRRLPMYEITRPLLITEQIQRAQRALNLACSMLPRNVVTGGFLERVLLNAQMPGHWEKDTDGNPTRFVPEAFATGAGTTAFVSGIEVTDELGKRSLTSPDVKWREPIPVDASIAAKQEHYKDILEEAKQGHIIAGTDSKLGWKSREQLRADSDKALQLTRTPTESAGRWLLETALAMAEAFMGQPGKYTGKLRAEFMCLASSGPISMDEAKDNRDASNGGYLARATAMERNGVDDVDAELSRINNEVGARIDLAVKQAEALLKLTQAGASLAGAARYMGIDEERARLLLAGDTDDGDIDQ